MPPSRLDSSDKHFDLADDSCKRFAFTWVYWCNMPHQMGPFAPPSVARTSCAIWVLRSQYAKMNCQCIVFIFLLVGLACCEKKQTKSPSPDYLAPQVQFNEISHDGCLDVAALFYHLAHVDPHISAQRFTYDIHINPVEENCAGTEARLIKGNFSRKVEALRQMLSIYKSISQEGCLRLLAVDQDDVRVTMTVIDRAVNETKFRDGKGGIFGVQWIDPEMIRVRRGFGAIDLHHPRLLNQPELNLNQVETVEVIRWDARSLTPNFPLAVAFHPLLILSESTSTFPPRVATEINRAFVPEIELFATDFEKIQDTELLTNLQKCEPYKEPDADVEASPEI